MSGDGPVTGTAGVQRRDFFVSYTAADRPWAEWIGWVLEEAGYSVVIQAWDFLPGSNFITKMDEAAQQAERTVAVLSPAYVESKFAEAEWRAAFADDPTGESGKLVPVRVEEFDPAGLLRTIAYVDLVGLGEAEAQARLLARMERRRAKPPSQPQFPGVARSVPKVVPAAPRFPAAEAEEGSSPPAIGPDTSDEQGPSPPALARNHVVLLIHGIRTRGEWQSRIADALRDGDPSLDPISIGYGYLDVLRFLLPFLRRRPVEKVRRRIDTVLKDKDVSRVSVIAHSFGTYIVGRLLQESDLELYRLILCGSILSEDYTWDAVRAKLTEVPDRHLPHRYVVNDCGWRDIWPVLAKAATWGYGASGRFGFQTPLVFDRYHDNKHSGYFQDDFAETYWLPVLASDTIPRDRSDPPPTRPWVNILSILRLPVLALLVVAAFAIASLRSGPPETPPIPLANVSTTGAAPPTTAATQDATEATTTASAPPTTTTTTTTMTPAPVTDPLEAIRARAAEYAEQLVDQLVADDEIETLVGQLMVVNFPGPAPYNERYDLPYAERLFRDARVGGIYLSSTNCNINNGEAAGVQEERCADAYGYDPDPDTVGQVSDLVNTLQSGAFMVADELEVPFSPLFIVVDHEGDDLPLTHLVNGFHSIPSQMAIGATWTSQSANVIGRAVGNDLASVGVNLLLGPVADVMREPKPSPTDIGVRAFGSSPELVSAMAAQYIEGVREGSAEVRGDEIPRIATIVKHFPGHGASNEDPDDNLSRVLYPTTVAALDAGALFPFGRLAGELFTRRPDGFMSSHLIYPNIPECGEGGIFTLDPDCAGAFLAHMSEGFPGFDAWRKDSLIVTDSLGVEGLRRVQSAMYLSEDAMCDLAGDALKSSHDVLLLGRWTPADAESEPLQRWSRELETVQATVECLADRFRADERYVVGGVAASFKDRVREAAVQVLKTKYLLYPELAEFDTNDPRRLDAVTVSADTARELVGRFGTDVETVAREAVTEIVTDVATHVPWSGVQQTAEKSVVFIECWEPGSRLCPGNADAFQPGLLEELTSTVGRTFETMESIGLLNAWCAADRDHEDEFLAFYRGDGQECQVGSPTPVDTTDAQQPTTSVASQAAIAEIARVRQVLADADVVVFGVSASDPDSDVTLAIEDVVTSLSNDAVSVMIATNRPYFANRSVLGLLDVYLATYSKIQSSLVSALKSAIRGEPAAGTPPVHYPDVFDRDLFEAQERAWAADEAVP